MLHKSRLLDTEVVRSSAQRMDVMIMYKIVVLMEGGGGK